MQFINMQKLHIKSFFVKTENDNKTINNDKLKKKVMSEYAFGGTEVKEGANEGISEIDQNRTLIVEKLTDMAPVKPKIIDGLKTIDDVFNEFSPNVDIDFTDSEGQTIDENLKFQNVGDFGVKGITSQSKFLNDLTAQKEQNLKMVKQLKTNKVIRKVIENEESRTALINAMNALLKELGDK